MRSSTTGQMKQMIRQVIHLVESGTISPDSGNELVAYIRRGGEPNLTPVDVSRRPRAGTVAASVLRLMEYRRGKSPLTNREVRDILGLSVDEVSNALQELRRRKLVSVTGVNRHAVWSVV